MNDKKSVKKEFRGKVTEAWMCNCGHMRFILLSNGTAECGHCKTIHKKNIWCRK